MCVCGLPKVAEIAGGVELAIKVVDRRQLRSKPNWEKLERNLRRELKICQQGSARRLG